MNEIPVAFMKSLQAVVDRWKEDNHKGTIVFADPQALKNQAAVLREMADMIDKHPERVFAVTAMMVAMPPDNEMMSYLRSHFGQTNCLQLSLNVLIEGFMNTAYKMGMIDPEIQAAIDALEAFEPAGKPN